MRFLMNQWFWMNRLSKRFNDSLIDTHRRTAKFQYQEWQPHLNKGVNPLHYRSVCVRKTTLSRKCDNWHHCNHCVSLVWYEVFLTKGILQRPNTYVLQFYPILFKMGRLYAARSLAVLQAYYKQIWGVVVWN